MMQEIVKNNPFIRLVFPFILGVMSGFNIGSVFETFLLFSLISIIVLYGFVFLFIKGIASAKWLNLLLVAFFFNLGLYQTAQKINSPVEFAKKEVIKAEVLDYPDSAANSLKFSVRLKEKITDSSTQKLTGKAILYISQSEKTDSLLPGDQLLLKAKPELITNMGNPNEFDYKSWAANNGIFYRFFVNDNDWVKQHSASSFSLFFELRKVRRNLLNFYKRSGIADDELSVFTALTLGDKSMLEGELRNGYAAAGLMHVLAVSGLHVGIIYWVVKLLCKGLLRIKYGRLFRFLISIAVLWGYASLTGLSPSVTRAAVMFSVFVMGDLFGRKYAVYNSISLAAFILLFSDPYLIKNVGFQMSFLAVIGIVWLFPIIHKWIYVTHKWLDKVWQLFAVSIAAQLITTPLSLYYFNQFPLLFLLSNLLMIPIATVLMYLFLVLMVFSPFPWIAAKIGWIINVLTMTMNGFANWINGLDWAILKFSGLDTYQVISLYGILVYFSILGFRTTYKNLRILMFLVIAFMGYDSFLEYSHLSKNRFVVFNTFKSSLWVASSGSDYTAESPDTAMKNERYLEPLSVGYGINRDVGLVSYGNNQLKLFGHGLNSGIYYNADYFPKNGTVNCRWLVLSENAPGNLSNVLSFIKPEYIVADATVPGYKIKDWQKILKKRGLTLFSVTENGSFFETWQANSR